MKSLLNKIKKHTLTVSFLLIIMLFFSFGIFTIKGMFTLGHLTRTIYEHPLVVSNASLNAALNITKMHRSMKDVVLANSTDEMAAALESVAEGEKKVYQQLDIIREDILGEKGQALEKQTRQLFVNWKPIREEVVRLLETGHKQDAILITKAKGADHVGKLENKMLELTSYARNKATGFLEYAETSQSRLEQITIILTLAGVLLSALIAFIATYRVLKAEKILLDEKDKLQQALDEIKTLRGIIPICSHCKQLRDDAGIWKRIEEYMQEHSEASFSHGICPRCMKKYYSEVLDLSSEEK
jgi:Four helix bundle sensory module for signal transduction